MLDSSSITKHCINLVSNQVKINTMTENEKQLQDQIDEIKIELLRLSTQVEAYRNAQGQVVNLAFSLIVSGVIAVVISTVVRK